MKTFKQALTAVVSAVVLLGGAMHACAAGESAGKLYFLVEMDHVKSGVPPTKEASRVFIEQWIPPTLAIAQKYVAEGRIVAGGPAAGRIALRFIVQADSPQDVDRIVESLPLWRLAETRVTPLITFSDRRANVQILLVRLASDVTDNPASGK